MLDDNKYRIMRQVFSDLVPIPGVIMDFAHNPDDSFSVIVYNDNLRKFEAGTRKNILMSLINASDLCQQNGIAVYVERRANA